MCQDAHVPGQKLHRAIRARLLLRPSSLRCFLMGKRCAWMFQIKTGCGNLVLQWNDGNLKAGSSQRMLFMFSIWVQAWAWRAVESSPVSLMGSGPLPLPQPLLSWVSAHTCQQPSPSVSCPQLQRSWGWQEQIHSPGLYQRNSARAGRVLCFFFIMENSKHMQKKTSRFPQSALTIIHAWPSLFQFYPQLLPPA